MSCFGESTENIDGLFADEFDFRGDSNTPGSINSLAGKDCQVEDFVGVEFVLMFSLLRGGWRATATWPTPAKYSTTCSMKGTARNIIYLL